MRRHFLCLGGNLIVGIILLSSAGEIANASGRGLLGWGPSMGFSTTPEQFTVGLVSDFALASQLGVRNSADLAFGDSITTLTLGPSLVTRASLGRRGSVHGGVQLALLHSRYSNSHPSDVVGTGGESTNFGAALDIGYAHTTVGRNMIVVDMKAGITDHYPDFKATVGYEMAVGN